MIVLQAFLSWIPYLCGSTMKRVRPLQARFEAKGAEIPEYMTDLGYKGKTGVFTAADVMTGAMNGFVEWATSAEGAAALQAAAAAAAADQTF